MKKIVSLLMVFALAILPFASLAEAITRPVVLEDIGITMDLPAGWRYATYATAADNGLTDFFGFTEADSLAMLNDTGSSLYGVCDDFGITHVAVLATTGLNAVDMTKDDLNMDSVMLGFLTNYDNVKDSGYFKTDAAWFIYVHYSQGTGDEAIDTLQYVTNVNGRMYLIQFMSLYGVEINEISEGLFLQAVKSLRFINE